MQTEVAEAEAQPVSLSSFESLEPDNEMPGLQSAMTLKGIEEILLAVPATREPVCEHPYIPNAWLVEDRGGNKATVTFRRDTVDEYSPEVRLLTYGDPLFELLLTRAGVVFEVGGDRPH